MNKYFEIVTKGLKFFVVNNRDIGRLYRKMFESYGKGAEHFISLVAMALVKVKMAYDASPEKFSKLLEGWNMIVAGAMIMKEGWEEASPVILPILKEINTSMGEFSDGLAEDLAEKASGLKAAFEAEFPDLKAQPEAEAQPEAKVVDQEVTTRFGRDDSVDREIRVSNSIGMTWVYPYDSKDVVSHSNARTLANNMVEKIMAGEG